MDAGLSALIGSLAGAAATAVAGLAAMRSGVRGELARLRQEHEQFDVQGRADHVRVRRDARRAAYAGFAEAFYGVMELVTEAHEISEAGDARAVLDLIQSDACAAAHGRLLRARAVIAIEGPDDVIAEAEAVTERVNIWLKMPLRIAGISRTALQVADYASIESGFHAAFRSFTRAANRALDDEGTWARPGAAA
jgi:hypothetical protein